MMPDPTSFVPVEDQKELAAHASEPLRDSPEYRDQLRSNPRTCHLTHGKPAHASEQGAVEALALARKSLLCLHLEAPKSVCDDVTKNVEAAFAALSQRPTPATDASKQNPQCPTCGQRVPDSLLEKIVDAVMQPAHASEHDTTAFTHDAPPEAFEPAHASEPEWKRQIENRGYLGASKPSTASEPMDVIANVIQRLKTDSFTEGYNKALGEWLRAEDVKPAHASEPWTKETVRQLWRDNQIKVEENDLYDEEVWDSFFQRVANAHNNSQRPTPATDASEPWTKDTPATLGKLIRKRIETLAADLPAVAGFNGAYDALKLEAQTIEQVIDAAMRGGGTGK